MPRCWSSPDATDAFKLSVFSVLVTAIAGVGGCVAYVSTGSSLILSYGLENLVDFISSIVVLWRFYCPHGIDPSREAELQKREKRASVAISFVLALLGIAVFVAALEDFTHGEESPENLRKLAIIGFLSLLLFGFMAMVKFHYAKSLLSASLRKDAVCSLIGTVLSGSLFINTLIIMKKSSVWWLDPAVACTAAIVSLLYGLSSIYRAYVVDGIPVCNPRWWIASQGDGMDEITGRDLNEDDLKTTGESYAENELPEKSAEEGGDEEVEEKIV